MTATRKNSLSYLLMLTTVRCPTVALNAGVFNFQFIIWVLKWCCCLHKTEHEWKSVRWWAVCV